MKSEVIVELLKATPPVSLAATVLMGYPLSDWAFALGILLLLLQIFFLLRDKLWNKRGRK